MSAHPYSTSTLRSTTPPLFYHRPDGTAASYYTVPTREVDGLRIPTGNTNATAAPPVPPYPRTSVSLQHASLDRTSVQRPPPASAMAAPPVPPSPRLSGYSLPSVVNPYAAPPPTTDASSNPPPPRPSSSSYMPSMIPNAAAATGRWSYQAYPQPPQYPTVDPVAARVAAIDAEEAALASEEATLRVKLQELQMARKRQEEEQLYLSHGWAVMLENEERYYTEPVVDRRPDIEAREHHCAMLQDHLQEVEAQAQHAQAQLQHTDYILREVESFERERQRLQDGFQGIERRRRECVTKAERYFDVEAKRVVQGNKLVRQLDGELRLMTQRGPLAQVQGNSQRSPSSTRAVTFATDKSIVLDLGGSDSVASSADTAAPHESGNGAGGGMTNSYTGSSSHSTYHHNSGPADSRSMYDSLHLSEEDIGGTSVAFSLNDAKDGWTAKRRRPEVAFV